MALSRIKVVVATGAAVAAIGGISFGASAFAQGTGAARPAALPAAVPVAVRAPAPRAAAEPGSAPHSVVDSAAKVISQVIGHGRVDGDAWSVTLQFYPVLPAGYSEGKLPPGAPAQPEPTSLLCQRMVIGGVRIDHQGGPWADCRPVAGAHDPSAGGEEGLWGLHDKGTTGSRLFVANTGAHVAYGVVTLTDGTKLTGHIATVPHTGYRAWAVAVPDGRTISSVDQYDSRHHLLSHEIDWR